MEPASTIVHKLGGPNRVAAIVGVHRTRVSNWMRPKERGGTGGRIPQRHHLVILEAANARGLGITAENLLGLRAPLPVTSSEIPCPEAAE
jgi:hypothetical protein